MLLKGLAFHMPALSLFFAQGEKERRNEKAFVIIFEKY